MQDDTIITHELDVLEIDIHLFADLHIGAPECAYKEFSRYVSRIAKDKKAKVILAGDMMNNATRSSVSDVYGEILPPSEQRQALYKLLLPIKDKIIAGCGGNHEQRSKREVDNDPLFDVFLMLGIEERYRPNTCYLKLRLKFATYHLYVTHGASENKRDRFAGYIDGVDGIITGHTHQPVIRPKSKKVFPHQGDEVKDRPFVCVTCVPWLVYGGYAARKMLEPSFTCEPQILQLVCKSRDAGFKKMFIIQPMTLN